MVPFCAGFNSPAGVASGAWCCVCVFQTHTYHAPRPTLLPFQCHAWHEAWHVFLIGINNLRPWRGTAWH